MFKYNVYFNGPYYLTKENTNSSKNIINFGKIKQQFLKEEQNSSYTNSFNNISRCKSKDMNTRRANINEKSIYSSSQSKSTSRRTLSTGNQKIYQKNFEKFQNDKTQKKIPPKSFTQKQAILNQVDIYNSMHTDNTILLEDEYGKENYNNVNNNPTINSQTFKEKNISRQIDNKVTKDKPYNLLLLDRYKTSINFKIKIPCSGY